MDIRKLAAVPWPSSWRSPRPWPARRPPRTIPRTRSRRSRTPSASSKK
ncbi:MAG: hypothetical protein M0C28_42380 [Candidatus Moduliflexus flocculans]|nr:hypothetical protein [Candidatus Moduliflexus flocculans]